MSLLEANAWLNPTMDDDSDQESDDSGDEMLFPMFIFRNTMHFARNYA